MSHPIRSTFAVLATAGLLAGAAAPALADGPATCDEANQAITATNAKIVTDSSAVGAQRKRVSAAKATLKKARTAKARKAAAATYAKQSKGLTSAKKQLASDRRTLTREKQEAVTLCTPGY